MDKLPTKPSSPTHVNSKSSPRFKSCDPTTFLHPPRSRGSANKILAKKTTPSPEVTRTNPSRPKNLEEDDTQKLKSPYLSCLLEMLKMDGNTKLEIATQNKIMNNFQVITGMDCVSYARLNRGAPTNQTQGNGIATGNKCSCKTSTSEKKGSIGGKQTKDNFKRAATVQLADRPMTPVKPKPMKKQSLNCNKVEKVEDKATTGKKAESKGMMSVLSTVAGRNISLFVKKTNRPEEIRNYYNWRSFCCQKRYANNVPKLKEKLKFLEDDYASLPDDMMKIATSRTPPVIDSPESNSNKQTNSVVEVGSKEMLLKPKKKILSKCKPRNVSSSPALRNADPEIARLGLCTSSSTKEFKSPLLKSSSNTTPVTKAKSSEQKPKRFNQKDLTGNDDEDFQKMMQFAIANSFEYEPPGWELSNLMRVTAVCIPSDEEQKNTYNRPKLKSRFTIKNKSLDQLKIPAMN